MQLMLVTVSHCNGQYTFSYCYDQQWLNKYPVVLRKGGWTCVSRSKAVGLSFIKMYILYIYIYIFEGGSEGERETEIEKRKKEERKKE